MIGRVSVNCHACIMPTEKRNREIERECVCGQYRDRLKSVHQVW